MIKILKKLVTKMDKVKPICPKCGGKMVPELIDLKREKIVFGCEKCGKRFV